MKKKIKSCLRKTDWFLMTSTDTNVPVPQLEEGITEVRWMNKIEVQNALKNTYASIADLLKDPMMDDALRHLG